MDIQDASLMMLSESADYPAVASLAQSVYERLVNGEPGTGVKAPVTPLTLNAQTPGAPSGTVAYSHAPEGCITTDVEAPILVVPDSVSAPVWGLI